MKIRMKKLFGIMLSFALVLGLMPGMSLTAKAAEQTISINSITDTLSAHGIQNIGGNSHSHLEFYKDNADSRHNGTLFWGTFVAPSGKIFTKIEVTGANDYYENGKWSWTGTANSVEHDNFSPAVHVGYNFETEERTYTTDGLTIKFTLDDATTYSVIITPGSNMTKTTGSGAESQTGLSGAMTPVVYTADDGYYFPTNYSVAEVSGIKVTRDSYTQITVSGTPTANASIKLTAPTAKTKEAAVVTKTPTEKTLTYNGKAQELVTAGKAEGGEMQYALGADETTAPADGWGTPIPKGTDARTYYVWYKAKGDGSHTDSSPVCLTVKIKEAHTHKFEHFEEKDSTYTESGYKAHYECTECGMWAEDANGVHIYTEEEKQKLIIPPKTRPSDSDSDTDNSDGSNMGSRDSRDSSSGKSSSTSAEVQSMIDQINTTSSVAIPENHQVETGAAASDVGGNWDHQVNADTWTYTKSDGTLAKSEWMSLDYNGLRYWYYFNDDGNMRTNWFDYNNERFYLMPEKDGWRGRMATGWKNIENKWYYFETVPGSSQGRLYRSSVTPDGHTVGADGAWNGVGETPVGQK